MSEPKITKDNLECTDLWKKMREGHPDKYYMEFYYKWLVRVKNFNAEAILDVIYNGHKYKEKYYFEWRSILEKTDWEHPVLKKFLHEHKYSTNLLQTFSI